MTKVMITGGTGTLGRAIVPRARSMGWDITIFSRDPMKHYAMKQIFPDLKFVLGDITDFWALYNAMSGHDIVIHAAAMKHIPDGEHNPTAMYEINVTGSRNVAQAAVQLGIKKVVGISTDKACHPVNVYGCTKMMMERMFMEYSLMQDWVDFHVVRYGNVFGSSGSFIHKWRIMVEEEGKIYSTAPDMTRFWFSEEDAATLVIETLAHVPGTITIPLLPSLGLDEIAEYLFPGNPIDYMGLRPGEKIHEQLITEQEAHFAEEIDGNTLRLWPVSGQPLNQIRGSYDSDEPNEWITKVQLIDMVGE